MKLYVSPEGFEPSTASLEGRCSIQLSYEPVILKLLRPTVSGWQDSNLRPPRPKRGAMTGLRYTPSAIFICGETGTRTLATVTRRQISNLLHYHSGTSPFDIKIAFDIKNCECKCSITIRLSQGNFNKFPFFLFGIFHA